MKIKIFNHNDLDSLGCEYVIRKYFEKQGYEVENVCLNYNTINKYIEKFITNKGLYYYDKVFITDISVNEETAELIDKYGQGKFILIDHHISEGTEHLNQYDWCILQGEKEHETCSATWLVWKYFVSLDSTLNTNYVKDIVTSIDRWDTWNWVNLYNNYKPSKQLNDLYYEIGRDRLYSEIEKQEQVNNAFILTDTLQLILDIREEKYNNLLENSNRYMEKINLDNYTVGVVYTNQFISELGNDLAKLNEDVDFIMIINLNGGMISLRSIKDNIHLGDWVKEFFENKGYSAGGHKQSAGVSLGYKKRNEMLKNILGI